MLYKRFELWIIALCVIFISRPTLAEAGSHSLIYDGLARTYHLHIPDTYTGEETMPLVVALHPFTSTGLAMEHLTGLSEASDEAGFIVVYPDSRDFFWNDGRVAQGWPPHWEMVDDVGFIHAVIDKVSEEYKVNAEEIHLLGWENGGLMATRLVCKTPERFDTAIVFSAIMWEYNLTGCAEKPSKAVNLLFIYGSLDPYNAIAGQDNTLPGDDTTTYHTYNMAETIQFWAERHACDLTTAHKPQATTVEIYADCADETTLTVYKIQDGGKNWPRQNGAILNQHGFNLTELITQYLDGEVDWAALSLATVPRESLHGSIPRSFNVYVPPDYDQSKLYPLVIALHGRPDTGNGFAYRMDMNWLAREQGLIVAYPDGIQNEWNYTANFVGFAGNGIDDVDFLSVLADDLAIDFNIDKERMYVAGFSNGGFMTQRMACDRPDKFAAFAIIGATLFPGFPRYCLDDAPTPILLMHGTRDISIPWNGTRQSGFTLALSMEDSVFFWVEHNGCEQAFSDEDVADTDPFDLTSVKVLKFTTCEADLDVYIIIGGGHNLPGMPGRIVPEIAGNVNTDIHTAQVLWDFFSKYPLGQTTTRQP